MAKEDLIIEGQNIVALRRKNHWSQKDLAELLNVSIPAIGRWEKDDEKMPRSTMYLVLVVLLLGSGIDLKLKETSKGPTYTPARKGENHLQRIERASRDLGDVLKLCNELDKAKEEILRSLRER